jgi:hypothetical protein
MARAGQQPSRRCLIVERHSWETGFAREQLQIPLQVAEAFFGTGAAAREIGVRIRDAGNQVHACSVTRRFKNGTRRINGLGLLGLMGPCFLFFEETADEGVYELSCQYDMPIVVARFEGWIQGRNSQHGRGRLAIVVDGPIVHPIVRADA